MRVVQKSQIAERVSNIVKLSFAIFALRFSICDSVDAAANYPTCSADSIMRLDEASQCWNRQDVGCVKLILDKVLSRQPNCAQGLHLRSFVAEREGRHQEAQALRERAEKLDPQLENFWKERGTFIEDSQLINQDFAHFRLRFRGGESRERAWRAVSYLNEAYNELGSQFGVFPDKKIDVIVMRAEDFVSVWRNPYIGGFFDLIDGKVRIRVDEDVPGGEKEYRRTCRHEFTHAFIYQLVPKQLPLWFAEGAAEFYAHRDTGDGLWKEKLMKQWRTMLAGQPPMTLQEIHEAIEKKRDGQKISLGYFYSAMFCLHVARERGESWIPRVVERLRAGRTMDQAFVDVVGVEPALMYERMWKTWE